MFLGEDNKLTDKKIKIDKTPVVTPWQSTWLVVVVVAFIAGIAGSLFSQGYLFTGNFKDNFSGLTNNQPLAQKLAVQEESATTEVVKKVSLSVVSIIVSKDLSKVNNQTGPNIFPFDLFNQGSPFNFFFEPGTQPQQPAPQGKQEVGGGTGFVINKEKGLILTNRHVVEDTEADYTVLTNDGSKYEARVVARDSVNDMALVQITNHDLPQVELGDSDKVELGQTVIAIGNALGEYRNTITKGVISGIGRNIVAGDGQGSSESLEGVFQTDAAINPGNSGGPLVNLASEVIGMNTAVSRQGQLIGFAIPINEVKRMIGSFDKYGKIVRPFLGIRYITVTPEVAKANKLEIDYGALIVKGQQPSELAVIPGSPADKAGLVENDIILEVNGQKIDQDHSLIKTIAKFAPGDTVTLKVYHKGEQKQVQLKLEEFKESQ
ncbi:MAG: trypsin-like peptidase domain-containing protein [Patescibacteria group bacterium]